MRVFLVSSCEFQVSVPICREVMEKKELEVRQVKANQLIKSVIKRLEDCKSDEP